MKSSSELFPVSLLRADALGDLTEDVYLIKHNRDPDTSVQVAVSHLGYAGKPHTGQPVILLHGSFTNRGFWLSGKGEGLARYLLDAGFDVWLMEMRGHGLSPRNTDYRNNTLERYVLHDLPAVTEFVHEQTEQLPVWMGHSLGGVAISSAVAGGQLSDSNCLGMVLLGTQTLRRPLYRWIPLTGTLIRTRVSMKGEVDGRDVGIGPENEPAAVINEHLRRQGVFGSWQFAAAGKKLLPSWKAFHKLPLLALAAAGDQTDPLRHCVKFADLYGGERKEIIQLGKASGFSLDYDHVGMIVSPEAAAEVWPRISDWLTKLQPAG
ncbi:MAG: alpha/beta hydrolase [Pseudomonadota bacterium]|nr:alpha/beta hydrolase [Pseudomonadota bacterium]